MRKTNDGFEQSWFKSEVVCIHGLMSFHVLFQCERYKGSVGPGEIRDFRGAMVGRADKGLFITTGTFTPDAVRTGGPAAQANQDASRRRAACLAAYFPTKGGQHTDPFTLQYVAGHDNIKTTMRYVHAREEAVQKLFARLGNLVLSPCLFSISSSY